MQIFDFHVHCYPENLASRAIRAMSSDANTQTDGTWDGQLQYMKQHKISCCTMLNMAATPHSMHKVNQYALESVRPGQLIFGSVHPEAPDAEKELEWLYEKGIRGVKFHTGYQKFSFDNPKYFPLYRKIGELGMATTIHCGPFFEDREHLVWPSVVDRAIECFGGNPFVCAHMGGISPEHPEFSLLRDMPVFVDTALSPMLMDREQFAGAVTELGEKRVLFGTDMPWEDPEKLIGWINGALAGHSEINRENIFYHNAMNIYRKLQSGSLSGAQRLELAVF